MTTTPKNKEDLLDLDVRLAVIESKFDTWIKAASETKDDLSFLRHKIHRAIADKFEQD